MKKHAEENPIRDWPNSEVVVQEFFENTTDDDNEMKSTEEPIWKMPVELQNFPNLPPSLWPITSSTISDQNLTQWGA